MASASLSGFSMTGWNANSFRPQLPLPPVTYPPFCGKGCTFSYFMHSKLMALAFLILGISFFVSFICAFLPFWFVVKFNIFDSTFGSEGLRQLTADLGIFFYTDDDYISLLFLEKMTNRVMVPDVFKVAQVTELLSVAIVGCSFVGAGILAFRKYSSVTGALFLAALETIGALGQLFMVIFSVITALLSTNDDCDPNTPSGPAAVRPSNSTGQGAVMAAMGPRSSDCAYYDNLVWRNLFFKEQYRRINQHTTPKLEANWALYIAIIGALLAIAGCVLLWIEGLTVCKTVDKIRYQQLRQKRDVHENERDPTDFIISPPARHTSRMYSGPPAAPYPSGRVIHSHPRPTYDHPPSMSGSSMQSGSAYVSREIDL